MIAGLFIGTLITFVRSTPVLSLFIPIASEIEAVSDHEYGHDDCLATLLVLSSLAHTAACFISRFTMGEATAARFVSLRIAL